MVSVTMYDDAIIVANNPRKPLRGCVGAMAYARIHFSVPLLCASSLASTLKYNTRLCFHLKISQPTYVTLSSVNMLFMCWREGGAFIVEHLIYLHIRRKYTFFFFICVYTLVTGCP